MISQNLTVHDFVNILIRHKWLILGSVAFCSGIAVAACFIWPKSYRSTTTILVESQKVPETYVKGVVSGTIQERLASVRQIVISRQLLSQVAREVGLVSNQGNNSALLDEVVAQITKSVQIDISKEQTALKLSYAHSNPVIAREVTSKIASLIVEENLKRREQLIEGATEFLQQELKLAKAQLEAKEKAITEFKGTHMGELPEQMEANLRALDRLQIERSTTTETINTLNVRLDSVEKAIREYQPGDAESGQLPTPNAGQRPIDRRLEQLRDLEQRLAVLSAEYKDNYPDIIHLKEEIRSLRAIVGTSADKPEEAEVTDINGRGKGNTKAVLDPYLNELMKQRNEIKNDLVVHKQRLARIASQIAQLEARVERTPAREQQLMILNRDYDNLQKNYQSLLDKQLSASISENLERHQKGEQFRVIDPANLPRVPESPNQLMIMLAGVAAGVGIGYGWAFWLEYGRGVVRTPGEAELLAGFPVLATIPDLATAYKGGFPHALPVPDSESRQTELLAKNGEINCEREPAARDEIKALTQVQSQHSSAKNGKRKEIIADFRRELNLVSKWRPKSLAAEQFRVAATRMVLSSSDLKSTVVVVTSAVKGEGKSSSVSNLGYVLAQDLGKPTLLIDCDFKHPSLHLHCGVPSSPGSSDVLAGECAIADALHEVGVGGPFVLPIGSRSRIMEDLAKLSKLRTIIMQFRDRFEYIVLDAPPVLPLADMNILCGFADFFVFVVRADMTYGRELATAVKSLQPIDRGGVLVTGCSSANAPKYLGSYYYAAYGQEES